MNDSPPPPDSDLPPDGLEELGGLSPRELFADSLQAPAAAKGKWEPPSAEHVARLLPQYRVEALIGHGGMGAVYRGAQPKLERFVAIKLLPAELAADPEFTARFEREARTLAKLHHPNIVGIHDFGQTSEGHLYFVMEFVDGTDLARIISSGSLEAMQALALTMQICDALQYAHTQRVIHRDIKPANVLVTQDGHAKLADFGLARPLNETEIAGLTASHLVMGTPDYMAPEQRAGLGDHRVDIFALGVMLYEMLTGRRPHGIFDPPSVKVQVDVRLDEVVIKAMRQEPERRYQQASEMRMDVDHIRSTPQPKIVQPPEVKSVAEPAASKTPAPLQKARRAKPALSSWLIPIISVVLLVLAAIVVVESGWLSSSSSPKALPEETTESAKGVATTADLPSEGWISLMDRIDPTADAVKGKWSRAADGIRAVGPGSPNNSLQLPYEPPAEYDFRIVFDSQRRVNEAHQFLIAMGHRFRWTNSGGGEGKRRAGFDKVNGALIAESPAAVDLPEPAPPGRRVESIVEIRRDHVTGYINGKKMVEWKTDYSEMGGNSLISDGIAKNRLGIGAWDNETTFHDISVREVNGKGKFLRDAPAPSVGSVSATKEKPFVNSLGQEFVPVPRTPVLFCRWETRVKDYAAYAKVNQVDDTWTKKELHNDPISQEPERPVVGITCDNADAFCEWLTASERAAGKLPPGMVFRLPTDEEWSCAVGLPKEEGVNPNQRNEKNTVDFPWGKDYPPKGKVGNYWGGLWADDGYPTTSPVGSFPPNAYGIYDLGGNVWEFCEELSAEGNVARVIRGASWMDSDRNSLLSSRRNFPGHNAMNGNLGFRVVLAPLASALPVATTVLNATPPSTGWISLMNRIDPAKDAVKKKWLYVEDGLEGSNPNKEPGPSVLQLPYEPPQEYDFRISFTTHQGNREAAQVLSAFGKQFCWVTSSGQREKWAGFDRVDGKRTHDSAAAVKLPGIPELDRRYESLVEVRRDRVTGYIDGKKMVEWKTDYHDFTIEPDYELPNPRAIGIGIWWSHTVFHDISVREVTGKGKFLREPFTPQPAVVSSKPGSSAWRYLFDGKTFAGWDLSTIRNWSIVDSALLSDKPGMIFAEPKFLNYELELEWRMKPGGNGGLFYGINDKRFSEAPEFQLCDPQKEKFRGPGGPEDRTGSVCGLLPPSRDASLPVGQWNTARLIVNGTHREHWVNGAKVLEYDLASDSYRNVIQNHPFIKYPSFTTAGPGAIALQSNWGEVGYRNIRVRELSGQTAAAPQAASKEAPFVNTLGMKFVPVTGTHVLFGIWHTRVQDYAAFARANRISDQWQKQEKDGMPIGREPLHPVCAVSWQEAQDFCQWLTQKEISDGKLPKGLRYRLPTDAEWSLAVGISETGDTPSVKAGWDSVHFPWGETYPPQGAAGNYADLTFHERFPSNVQVDNFKWIEGYRDGYATTSPVGSFPANAFGLYDMGGNLWQWCEDWWDNSHQNRVLRGASWLDVSRGNLLCSGRGVNGATAHGANYGFRCVLDLGSSNSTGSAVTTSPSSDGWISLLPKINLQADPLRGSWSKTTDDLRVETSNVGYLQLPYDPPQEYDFRVSFTSLNGRPEMLQFLTLGDHAFRWTTNGAGDHRAGFDTVGGKAIQDSPAAVVQPTEPALNRRYESLVEVRRDRISGYIDGRKLVEYKTNGSEMCLPSGFSPPKLHSIGIGIWSGTTLFHDVSVRETKPSSPPSNSKENGPFAALPALHSADFGGWDIVGGVQASTQDGLLVLTSSGKSGGIISRLENFKNLTLRMEVAGSGDVNAWAGLCMNAEAEKWRGYSSPIRGHDGVVSAGHSTADFTSPSPKANAESLDVAEGEFFTLECSVRSDGSLWTKVNGRGTSALSHPVTAGHVGLLLDHGTLKIRKIEVVNATAP